MELDNVYVADIETKGMLEDLHGPDDFHVLSVGWKVENKWRVKSTNSLEAIQKVFCNSSNVIVMHNGYRYDVPALEKMFGFKVTATIIDSLPLACYLPPGRLRYC